MVPSNGQLITVPPGFRFHPTDEELLYYYLRKKIAYEVIDLDVIRDVDLNKLEPWDLKDRCRIGTGPQNEWYFFSHKDKKYPTGTRTNRATTVGFWKATGRDKAIHFNNSKRIGMRKTLVFYTGRAPHGKKTDWIMHEYRLDDESSEVQEEGWVVCRVFMKKSHQGSMPPEAFFLEDEELSLLRESASTRQMEQQKQNLQMTCNFPCINSTSMHLPQLMSSESNIPAPYIPCPATMNPLEHLECPQNLMKLTSGAGLLPHEKFNGDWSILDKLLASSNQNLDQIFHHNKCSTPPSTQLTREMGSSVMRLPLQYLGCETDLLKFSE